MCFFFSAKTSLTEIQHYFSLKQTVYPFNVNLSITLEQYSVNHKPKLFELKQRLAFYFILNILN